MRTLAKLLIVLCCLALAGITWAGTASPVTDSFGVPTYFNNIKVKEGVLVGPNQQEVPLENGYSITYEDLIADITGIVDGKIPPATPRGYITGLVPRYLDADEISWSGGTLDIDGGTYHLEAATTVDMDQRLGSAFAANTWYYVYLDPPEGSETLGAADFEVSATAPSYQAAQSGWYHPTNSDWRCIGVFKTSTSSQIMAFACDGRLFEFMEAQQILYTSTPSTGASPGTLSCGAPEFQTPVAVQLSGFVHDAGNAVVGLDIMPGDSVSLLPAYQVARQSTLSAGSVGEAERITNATGQVGYFASANSTVTVNLLGFRFPSGLAR